MLQKIRTQCGTFDAKPLATCICWQCGSVIPSHRGSYLVDIPTGKSIDYLMSLVII